jgi:hypothetical protein
MIIEWRRWMWCCLAAVCSMAVSVPTLANEPWAFDIWEMGGSKVCSMMRPDNGRSVLVLHIRISGNPDAGIVGFGFGDLGLQEAAQAKQPVQLVFDTGTVDGYQLEPGSNGVSQVQMMTYALADLFAKFDQASRVDVVTSTARASFDLTGFADALAKVKVCAQTS